MYFRFCGLFHFSELSNILCKHIVFHIKILVPHCKTDVYREGTFQKIANRKSHRQVEFVCFSPSPLYTKGGGIYFAQKQAN